MLEHCLESWDCLEQAKDKLLLYREIPQLMYIERTSHAKLPPSSTASELGHLQNHTRLFALESWAASP